MPLTLQDIYNQADYLVVVLTGLTIYMQKYDEDNELTLEYDNGEFYTSLSLDTYVEATSHGTVIINDVEYLVFVAQQIRFTPEQE